MKFLKRTGMVLFIGWSILMILILSFGTSVSTKISHAISSHINDSKVHLKGVEVNPLDYYPIENVYDLPFTINPKNDEEYGITYT